MCSNNEASDSARIITCAGTGADLRVFMLAVRDAPIRVVIVAARVKTVSSHKDALAAKKKNPTLISSQTRTTFHLYVTNRAKV